MPKSPQEPPEAEISSPSAALVALIRRYPLSAPVDVLAEIHQAHAAESSAAEQTDPEAGIGLGMSLSSGLVARAYLDLGDPRAAIAQADVALWHADRTGSPGARARYRALQSEAAFWAGWPHEAMRYARLGSGIGGHAGTGGPLIKFMAARSHAILGDHARALADLGAAEAALAEVSPDGLDDIGGTLHLDVARSRYYEAEVRVHVRGAAEAAAECALSAIKSFGSSTASKDPTSGGPHAAMAPEAAAATAVLALAYAHQELLDGVGATLDALVSLAPSRRTAPVVLSAARVHAALRRPEWIRSRRVREMQEQIEAFCQVPAGSMPCG
jgi:hypothetical protein